MRFTWCSQNRTIEFSFFPRERNILYFDFMEMQNGLPTNLDLITCTLNELADNCRIITKELFISENFENP